MAVINCQISEVPVGRPEICRFTTRLSISIPLIATKLNQNEMKSHQKEEKRMQMFLLFIEIIKRPHPAFRQHAAITV